MILIVTTSSGDASHIGIVDWLSALNANYLVISGEDIMAKEHAITIQNGFLFYDGINLTKEISCVFYRRWFSEKRMLITEHPELNETLIENLQNESKNIRDYLYFNLKDAHWYPNLDSININKLSALEQASNCRLMIPEYIITNKKQDLINFFQLHKENVITKAIGNYTNFPLNKKYYTINQTHKITRNIIDSLPETFALSLFQRNIEKIMEVRLFYFDGLFFATGILSQNDEISKIDSRAHGDFTQGASLVPIEIPKKLKVNVKKYMDKLRLNTGSLDFIIDEYNNYIFLEINPVGQFSGYSKRCGFNFEKNIVEHLIKIDIAHGIKSK